MSVGYSSTSNEEEEEINRKRKKVRTAFSRKQVADLENKFQEKKYLSSAERGDLADRLKLSDVQVKTWFQNRRMKFKRQSEEADMESKSLKFPHSSFMSYGSAGSFYNHMPVPYKSHDGGCVPYTYGRFTVTALDSPSSLSPHNIAGGGMDTNKFMANSTTMLESFSSPLSASMSPYLDCIEAPISQHCGISSYISTPSSGCQPWKDFGNEATPKSGTCSNLAQHSGYSEWPIDTPASFTP